MADKLINSLVVEYVKEHDAALGKKLAKKFETAVLPSGSPNVKEVVEHFFKTGTPKRRQSLEPFASPAMKAKIPSLTNGVTNGKMNGQSKSADSSSDESSSEEEASSKVAAVKKTAKKSPKAVRPTAPAQAQSSSDSSSEEKLKVAAKPVAKVIKKKSSDKETVPVKKPSKASLKAAPKKEESSSEESSSEEEEVKPTTIKAPAKVTKDESSDESSSDEVTVPVKKTSKAAPKAAPKKEESSDESSSDEETVPVKKIPKQTKAAPKVTPKKEESSDESSSDEETVPVKKTSKQTKAAPKVTIKKEESSDESSSDEEKTVPAKKTSIPTKATPKKEESSDESSSDEEETVPAKKTSIPTKATPKATLKKEESSSEDSSSEEETVTVKKPAATKATPSKEAAKLTKKAAKVVAAKESSSEESSSDEEPAKPVVKKVAAKKDESSSEDDSSEEENKPAPVQPTSKKRGRENEGAENGNRQKFVKSEQALNGSNKIESCDLFVRNIGNLSEDDLYDYFKEFGNSTVRIAIDRETGHSRGFAFVTYETPAAAKTALSNGWEGTVKGHTFNFRIAEPKPSNRDSFGGNKRGRESGDFGGNGQKFGRNDGGEEESTELFVVAINPQLTEDDLFSHFKQYGNVQRTKILMDRETGERRDIGFVTFESSAEAKAAADAGYEANIDGHYVKVRLANPSGSRQEEDSQVVCSPSYEPRMLAHRPRVGGEPFRRVREEDVNVDPRFNNSYMSKRGAMSDWGKRAHESLINTRGKGFRHEKNKKKKGSYTGGFIDLKVNSIKFDD